MTDFTETIETGTVIEIRNDLAIVRLQPDESCEKCAAKLFCRPNTTGERTALAVNRMNASIGQRVGVTETGNTLLYLSILQYGLPLMGLLIGILGVYWMDTNPLPIPFELTMTLGGAIGLLIAAKAGFVLTRRYARRINSVFEIVSIIE